MNASAGMRSPDGEHIICSRSGGAHAASTVEIGSNSGHNQALQAVIPIMKLAFEDFKPGPFGTFGPRHVTREEIIAFATEFDPQPMHLDEGAAKKSMLKGLAGSGWHMTALMMRMMYDGYLHRTLSMGAPGVDEVKWLAPFRPGDDLTLTVEVMGTRPSQSRPDMGFVTFKCSVSNAAGLALAEMTAPLMIQRRNAAAANQA